MGDQVMQQSDFGHTGDLTRLRSKMEFIFQCFRLDLQLKPVFPFAKYALRLWTWKKLAMLTRRHRRLRQRVEAKSGGERRNGKGGFSRGCVVERWWKARHTQHLFFIGRDSKHEGGLGKRRRQGGGADVNLLIGTQTWGLGFGNQYQRLGLGTPTQRLACIYVPSLCPLLQAEHAMFLQLFLRAVGFHALHHLGFLLWSPPSLLRCCLSCGWVVIHFSPSQGWR